MCKKLMDKKKADRIVVLLMNILRSIYSPDTVYAITNEIRNLIDPYTRNTGAIITDGKHCDIKCPHLDGTRCRLYCKTGGHGLWYSNELQNPVFRIHEKCKSDLHGEPNGQENG